MAHQGFDLQLTRYDERGWRATFYTSGMEHYEAERAIPGFAPGWSPHCRSASSRIYLAADGA
jgi:hypothetical protein